MKKKEGNKFCEIRYKALDMCMMSGEKNGAWQIGKWYNANDFCRRGIIGYTKGFFASTNIIDAMRESMPGYICEVEVKGESNIDRYWECWSEMKIISSYSFSLIGLTKIALFAVNSVIDIFGKVYPNDTRLERAVCAAESWLAEPTEKNIRLISEYVDVVAIAASVAECDRDRAIGINAAYIAARDDIIRFDAALAVAKATKCAIRIVSQKDMEYAYLAVCYAAHAADCNANNGNRIFKRCHNYALSEIRKSNEKTTAT